MKFVIDEDLPRSTGVMLRELGHTVFDVRDVGLRGSPDEAVFRFAQKHKAVLITADLGFALLLRFWRGKHNGVIILRFPSALSNTKMNNLIATYLPLVIKEDFVGALFIFSPKGIRIRRL